MRDVIYIYFAICIVALVLKYFGVFMSKIITPGQTLDHEQEHDMGNYIKIFILILLAITIWYFINSGGKEATASAGRVLLSSV